MKCFQRFWKFYGWLLIAGLSVALLPVEASSASTATIVRLEGTAQVLTEPSAAAKSGVAGQVMFDGKFYASKQARAGLKIGKGDVLQTGKDSKVRLIFPNGDAFTISPDTAYRMDWEDEKKPMVDLMFGKVRAVIRKGGPRQNLNVRANSAVMGVRGTDFFVRGHTPGGGSALHVLRGEVTVAPRSAPQQQVAVASGFSAEIPAAPTPPTEIAKNDRTVAPSKSVPVQPAIVLKRTTKSELIDIQQSSKVEKVGAPAGGPGSLSPESVELEALEKKAYESTVADIKETDPVLYQQVMKETADKPLQDVDNLQTVTVRELFKESPVSSEDSKPLMEELEKVGEGQVYDKYFKID